ncbi:hypothetical protein B0T26DRAFT_876845 [Lasiosphaeria miniovina]|uniref:Uncharacterized protein n=1 Tax=Lasiosphaeria miniovina TaxID=1954250 RepID=A0AA40DJU0_9PEZI|nr:uncharacterized protein B0T26DRAFT_876845 [Lasiosphaeria miniovina]KAK0704001.1 hypothetical protein B0T26DRAFT_876845 [Lasiosphaeria miniovina]
MFKFRQAYEEPLAEIIKTELATAAAIQKAEDAALEFTKKAPITATPENEMLNKAKAARGDAKEAADLAVKELESSSGGPVGLRAECNIYFVLKDPVRGNDAVRVGIQDSTLKVCCYHALPAEASTQHLMARFTFSLVKISELVNLEPKESPLEMMIKGNFGDMLAAIPIDRRTNYSRFHYMLADNKLRVGGQYWIYQTSTKPSAAGPVFIAEEEKTNTWNTSVELTDPATQLV